MSSINFIDSTNQDYQLFISGIKVNIGNFNLKSDISDVSNINRIGFIWINNDDKNPFGSTNYIFDKENNKIVLQYFTLEFVEYLKQFSNNIIVDLITFELNSENFLKEVDEIINILPNIYFSHSVITVNNDNKYEWTIKSSNEWNIKSSNEYIKNLSNEYIKNIYFNDPINNHTSILLNTDKILPIINDFYTDLSSGTKLQKKIWSQWNDISSYGMPSNIIIINGCTSNVINIGFNFIFNKQIYTDFTISKDGILYFGNNATEFLNGVIVNQDVVPSIVLFNSLWSNIDIFNISFLENVTYYTDNSKFIIIQGTFNVEHLINCKINISNFTFQIFLFKENLIKIKYKFNNPLNINVNMGFYLNANNIYSFINNDFYYNNTPGTVLDTELNNLEITYSSIFSNFSICSKSYGEEPFIITPPQLISDQVDTRTILYTSSDTKIASINGNQITILNAGTVNIIATIPDKNPPDEEISIENIPDENPSDEEISIENIPDENPPDEETLIDNKLDDDIIKTIIPGGIISTKFTIEPVELLVIANAQTKIYGDILPILTYTYKGLVNIDTNNIFTGSLNTDATDSSNVGLYSINQGSLSAGTNYNITFINNTLTIQPESLSIIADPQTKIYGDILPTLTYTSNGLVNTDTNDIFTGSLNTDATDTSDVGVYLINQGNLSAGNNYNITFINNNLTIIPVSIISSSINLSNEYLNDPTKYTWPIKINGGTFENPTIITFIDNITLGCVSHYFIIDSEYITINGNGKKITINNISNWSGFIQNGDRNSNISGKSFCNILNLWIISNGSILEINSGWVCKRGFGYNANNMIIDKCYVEADLINYENGGIVGTISGGLGDNSLIIQNCIFMGNISGMSSGGIGANGIGGFGGYCKILNCVSYAQITSKNDFCSGGIVAQSAACFGGTCVIENSYFIGSKTKYNGTIAGSNCDSGCTINNCYSTVDGYMVSIDSTCTINNCYYSNYGNGTGSKNSSFCYDYTGYNRNWNNIHIYDNLIGVPTLTGIINYKGITWTSLGNQMQFILTSQLNLSLQSMQTITNLQGIDLSNSILIGANLSNINLSGSNLSNVNLIGADLTNVNLTNVNLSNANLTNAILNGIILNGADLTNTIGLKSIYGFSLSIINNVHTYMLNDNITTDQLDTINFSDLNNSIIIDGNNKSITLTINDFNGLFIGGGQPNTTNTFEIKNLTLKIIGNINCGLINSIGNIKISNCFLFVAGSINDNGGGLVKSNSINNLNITIENSLVTMIGNIGKNAGPLIGYTCGCTTSLIQNSASIVIGDLFSNAGAFVGANIGKNSSSTINMCYCIFSGNMNLGSGILTGKYLYDEPNLTINNFYMCINIKQIPSNTTECNDTLCEVTNLENGYNQINQGFSTINNLIIFNLKSCSLTPIHIPILSNINLQNNYSTLTNRNIRIYSDFELFKADINTIWINNSADTINYYIENNTNKYSIPSFSYQNKNIICINEEFNNNSYLINCNYNKHTNKDQISISTSSNIT